MCALHRFKRRASLTDGQPFERGVRAAFIHAKNSRVAGSRWNVIFVPSSLFEVCRSSVRRPMRRTAS
jgi:hypothetical protein